MVKPDGCVRQGLTGLGEVHWSVCEWGDGGQPGLASSEGQGWAAPHSQSRLVLPAPKGGAWPLCRGEPCPGAQEGLRDFLNVCCAPRGKDGVSLCKHLLGARPHSKCFTNTTGSFSCWPCWRLSTPAHCPGRTSNVL